MAKAQKIVHAYGRAVDIGPSSHESKVIVVWRCNVRLPIRSDVPEPISLTDPAFDHSDIPIKLCEAYWQLEEIYLDAGGTLTDEVRTKYLPDQVFTLAVDLGLLEDPGNTEDEDGVWLGTYWIVSREYYTAFIDALALSEDVDGIIAPSKQTPHMLMVNFKLLSMWTDEDVVEQLLLRSSDGKGIDVSTFRRLSRGVNGHRRNLERLADLMKEKCPEDFKDLHWTHLRWPRKK
jgi:hypothetical protein